MISEYISKHLRHGISRKELYGAYRIFFGTLVSGSRLKIINLLRKCPKNVSEIMKETGLSQTAASHNLSRLKRCGFVVSKTEGKYRYYELNEKTIKPLMEIIDAHMSKFCVHILKEKGGKND